VTVGLIVCGALGKEVKFLIEKYNWDAEMIGVKAINHVFPDRIAPDVEERIISGRGHYDHLIVVFGDCGSKGELDKLLEKHPEIPRIDGPHCYEFYSGDEFDRIIKEEPGTYILTDFMVRTFNGLILKSMGLDRFPGLKKEYFKNYKRVIYLMQVDTQENRDKAERVAAYLELPLEIRYTGLGFLETRLVNLMNNLKAV
jgi:hypothetical protein